MLAIEPQPPAWDDDYERRRARRTRALALGSSGRGEPRATAGYLPYTYGRRSAQRIGSATAALRRRLAAQRPRVPARERRRTPRLALLQSDAVGHDHAELVALVDDGRRRYTVALELARTAVGWTVSGVGS